MVAEADADREAAENWALINTPLGEPWSGRTRYAAAMFFYTRGEISAEALEVYRTCSRLDSEDPLRIMRERAIAGDWLQRLGLRNSGFELRSRRVTPPGRSGKDGC